MTPEQERIMQGQYQYARDHEGETRPFDEWRKMSGQPAYFRGDLFGQWHDPRLYTDGHRQQFSKLRQMLQGLMSR